MRISLLNGILQHVHMFLKTKLCLAAYLSHINTLQKKSAASIFIKKIMKKTQSSLYDIIYTVSLKTHDLIQGMHQ